MLQFLHIAQNDPNRAAALCNRYGWMNCNSYEDIARGLFDICDQGGDQGTKEVMNLMPEKDLILHFFSKGDGACPNCQHLNQMSHVATRFAGADGTATNGVAVQQQNANNSHALTTALENNKLMVFGFLTLVTIVLLKSS